MVVVRQAVAFVVFVVLVDQVVDQLAILSNSRNESIVLPESNLGLRASTTKVQTSMRPVVTHGTRLWSM
jgi:hypothetical protein